MTQDQGSVSGTETIFDQFGIESHSESMVVGRDTSQPPKKDVPIYIIIKQMSYNTAVTLIGDKYIKTNKLFSEEK